jgi:hypothetical protein
MGKAGGLELAARLSFSKNFHLLISFDNPE